MATKLKFSLDPRLITNKIVRVRRKEVTVSIGPLEELNDNIDPETLAEIPLDCITKY